MEVELLLIPTSPDAAKTSELPRFALTDAGLPYETFTVSTVDTEQETSASGVAGSPAFVVDGRDLVAVSGSAGSLACRMNPTPTARATYRQFENSAPH